MAAKEQQMETVQPEPKNADSIINKHVVGSMGVGLIPMPLVDLAALTGVQLNMLRMLAKAYNVPFTKDTGKNVLASLMGGVVPLSFAGSVASLMKAIPVVGQTTGVLAMPATAGAVTYAIGKVFNQHFASGGTFLTFDPEKVKDYYQEMFKEGEKVAAGLKKESDKS
jgi:uncharacterized protein (DUF697 family)